MPAERRGSNLGAGQAIGVPVRGAVKGKIAVGVAIAAVLIMTLETGYVLGLRQAAWSRVGAALSANATGGPQVASRAANQGTTASSSGQKATKRAGIMEARAVSPQRGHRTLRNPAVAAASVQPDVTASQAVASTAPPPLSQPSEETASPSFWLRVTYAPLPIAPDPPSLH
jgi:hypothetical protein